MALDPTNAILRLDRVGTDCSYSNGQIAAGSSKKTPYVVARFAQPRYFAHTLQHWVKQRVAKEPGRENRESGISLTQLMVGCNRIERGDFQRRERGLGCDPFDQSLIATKARRGLAFRHGYCKIEQPNSSMGRI